MLSYTTRSRGFAGVLMIRAVWIRGCEACVLGEVFRLVVLGGFSYHRILVLKDHFKFGIRVTGIYNL
jgi:hypothetical protein